MHHVKTLFWRTLAVLALILGVIGAFLPVMPTVPFVLVAAWAAGKGWPRLESWLLAHATFGPPIQHWRSHGAVPRAAKWFATIALLFSATSLQFLPLPAPLDWLSWGAPLCFALILIWLWRRPEPPPKHPS